LRYKFSGKDLRYFFHIFSELHLIYRKKCGRRRFNALVPSTYVFKDKIEWEQEITTAYMQFCAFLYSWIAKCPVLCHLFTVALTRGLKRTSIAIPLSSSEISMFVETATQKAV